MANQQHLDLLKQGVIAWNAWRSNNPDIQPDLRELNLGGIGLRGANLSIANLRGIRLRGANLRGADLVCADLIRADLRETSLRETNLIAADLKGADLSEADLRGADLSEADLSEADLSMAYTGQTIFNDLDLRQVKGLETIRHFGPSGITTSTLERSEGDIPEVFLRGAGLSDLFITYARSLTQQPIQYDTSNLATTYWTYTHWTKTDPFRSFNILTWLVKW